MFIFHNTVNLICHRNIIFQACIKTQKTNISACFVNKSVRNLCQQIYIRTLYAHIIPSAFSLCTFGIILSLNDSTISGYFFTFYIRYILRYIFIRISVTHRHKVISADLLLYNFFSATRLTKPLILQFITALFLNTVFRGTYHAYDKLYLCCCVSKIPSLSL